MPQAPARTAIVTGSGRGIGRAIAAALGSRGLNVVVNYVANQAAAEETARLVRSLGGQAEVVQADINKAEDQAALLDRAIRMGGGVDVLVNNAGVAPKHRVDLLDLAEAGYDEVMATNLKAPFFLTQRVAQHMIERRRAAKPPPAAPPAAMPAPALPQDPPRRR